MEKFSNIEERRRYQRVESTLPIQYRNLRDLGKGPVGSLSKNVSEGGVRFRSSEFISLACRLVVEINLPSDSKPIKAISKVAWIKRLPTSDQYELGNQFLDMTKEDKARIIEFISQVLNKQI